MLLGRRSKRFLGHCWFLLFLFGLIGAQGCGENTPWREALVADLVENTLTFEKIKKQERQSKSFLIYNQSSRPIILQKLLLEGEKKSVFWAQASYPLPLHLAPGKDLGLVVNVAFLPPSAGSYQGTIRIQYTERANTDPVSELVVQLRSEVPVDPSQQKLHWECPNGLSFGLLRDTGERELSCSLKNESDRWLTLQKQEYQPKVGEASDFLWLLPGLPFDLGPDQRAQVRIRFQPNTAAKSQGQFVLTTSAPEIQVDPLHVQGEASLPQMRLWPLGPVCQNDQACTSIDPRYSCQSIPKQADKRCTPDRSQAPRPFLRFSLRQDGAQSTQRLLLVSSGSAPLVVSSIRFSDDTTKDTFALLGAATPFTLEAGQVREITIKATQRGAQFAKGNLELTSNAYSQPKHFVSLETRRPTGCDWFVDRSERRFTSPGQQEITLTNLGQGACQLERIELLQEGTTKPFVLEKGQTLPYSLAAGQSLVQSVRYTPQGTEGGKARLRFVAAGGQAPAQEVALLAGETRACALFAEVDLPFYHVRSPYWRSGTITLQNRGLGDCEISAIKHQPVSWQQAPFLRYPNLPTLPFVLKGAEPFKLEVLFQPPVTGTYTTAVEITSNDSQRPTLRVPVQARSAPECLEFQPSPDGIDLGIVKAGCTLNQTIKFRTFGRDSACTQDAPITSIQLSDASGSFQLGKVPTLPIKPSPSTFLSLTISGQNKSAGVYKGLLRFDYKQGAFADVTLPVTMRVEDKSTHKDVFQQDKRSKADILFVASHKYTLDERKTLASQAGAFFQWAERINADFHLGIIPSDHLSKVYKTGCLRGSPSFIDDTTKQPLTWFQKTYTEPDNDTLNELPLYSLRAALTPPLTKDSLCNKGFLREDAVLSLVFHFAFVLSETGDIEKDLYWLLGTKRGRKDQIRISTLLAESNDGEIGCSKGSVEAQRQPYYNKFAAQFTGHKQSYCSNTSNFMQDLARVTFEAKRHFSLTRYPVANSLQVVVDGKVVPQSSLNGWRYLAQENQILFANAATPPPGAIIEVQYQIGCRP